jgi:hypothetical protein
VTEDEPKREPESERGPLGRKICRRCGDEMTGNHWHCEHCTSAKPTSHQGHYGRRDDGTYGFRCDPAEIVLTRSQRKILRTLAQPQDNAGYVVSAFYGRAVIVIAEPGARGGFRARHRVNRNETLMQLASDGFVELVRTQAKIEFEGAKRSDYTYIPAERITLTPRGYKAVQ